MFAPNSLTDLKFLQAVANILWKLLLQLTVLFKTNLGIKFRRGKCLVFPLASYGPAFKSSKPEDLLFKSRNSTLDERNLLMNSAYYTWHSRDITFCVIILSIRKVPHIIMKSVTFCGDCYYILRQYYILRRNSRQPVFFLYRSVPQKHDRKLNKMASWLS